jgi:hypothetical protein
MNLTVRCGQVCAAIGAADSTSASKAAATTPTIVLMLAMMFSKASFGRDRRSLCEFCKAANAVGVIGKLSRTRCAAILPTPRRLRYSAAPRHCRRIIGREFLF